MFTIQIFATSKLLLAEGLIPVLQEAVLITFVCIFVGLSSGTCIQSKVGFACSADADCFEFQEKHLYCNTTQEANTCAFDVHTYASISKENMDCPGEEFSAEPWSNPISDDWMTYAQGVDCMRLCYLTETCFAVSVVDHKCYLKNENCFTNLRHVPGALLGVLSVTREDYHCGCHYPFRRQSSSGAILSWDSDCPESQLDRNPYRCCSEKGLCVKCEIGMTPNTRAFYDEQASGTGVLSATTSVVQPRWQLSLKAKA